MLRSEWTSTCIQTVSLVPTDNRISVKGDDAEENVTDDDVEEAYTENTVDSSQSENSHAYQGSFFIEKISEWIVSIFSLVI